MGLEDGRWKASDPELKSQSSAVFQFRDLIELGDYRLSYAWLEALTSWISLVRAGFEEEVCSRDVQSCMNRVTGPNIYLHPVLLT